MSVCLSACLSVCLSVLKGLFAMVFYNEHCHWLRLVASAAIFCTLIRLQCISLSQVCVAFVSVDLGFSQVHREIRLPSVVAGPTSYNDALG